MQAGVYCPRGPILGFDIVSSACRQGYTVQGTYSWVLYPHTVQGTYSWVLYPQHAGRDILSKGYMCMPIADLKSRSVWVGRGYSLPSAWGQCTIVASCDYLYPAPICCFLMDDGWDTLASPAATTLCTCVCPSIDLQRMQKSCEHS